jgi:hypothetical protein
VDLNRHTSQVLKYSDNASSFFVEPVSSPISYFQCFPAFPSGISTTPEAEVFTSDSGDNHEDEFKENDESDVGNDNDKNGNDESILKADSLKLSIIDDLDLSLSAAFDSSSSFFVYCLNSKETAHSPIVRLTLSLPSSVLSLQRITNSLTSTSLSSPPASLLPDLTCSLLCPIAAALHYKSTSLSYLQASYEVRDQCIFLYRFLFRFVGFGWLSSFIASLCKDIKTS